MGTPSNRTIVGVGILLFTSVLMGVAIHHLVKTGTCSSTGYSGSYGPVPYCPSGTGWWIGFLMLGIFGGIIGGFIAEGSTVGLINGFIFTAIGVGSVSVVFDKHASSKAFAGVFGGCFALVGGTILAFVLVSALRSLTPGSRRPGSHPSRSSGTTSAFGTPQRADGDISTSTAFGKRDNEVDPILGAYAASSRRAESGIGGFEGLEKAAAPAATPASRSSDVGSALDSISKLSDLHKSGALTDEEFAREKAKLLGS